MKNFIKVIELHFSNKCTGNCRICSKLHGGVNYPFVTEEVVDAILNNLKPGPNQVKCKILQLGGDGDSFLSPLFIPTMKRLKYEVPDIYTCLYTNFIMLTQDCINIIINNKLLDELHVRIDSLQPEVYKWSTGLDLYTVKENIKYFLKHNEDIRFEIIYFPLYKYREICMNNLHKEPTYFKGYDKIKDLLYDEQQEVMEYFDSLPRKCNIEYLRSGICLWGERTDCEIKAEVPCTRLPENDGAFDNLVLIYPNGSLGLCAYGDDQNSFILGNILEDSLINIWNSGKREQYIEDIRKGKYFGKYPCINPKACYFYNV